VGAFGDKLRKQREQRGIELDAISNTTKISTRMLRALEEEHFDQLPGGVFNKGFVRAYARLVGLNEEEAIADYLEALRESQILAQSILPDFRSPAGRPDTAAVREAPHSTIHGEVFPGNNGSEDHAKTAHRENAPRGGGNQEQDHRKQGRSSEDRLISERSSLPEIKNRAADPEHPGSMQNAGTFAPTSDSTSTQVPWGKLAGALLLVALTLAVWNSRRHGETAAASHAAAASNQTPASPQSGTPVSAQLSSAAPASRPANSLTAAKAAQAPEVLSAGKVSEPTPLTLSSTVSPPSSGTSLASVTNTLTTDNSPEPQVDHSDAGSSALPAAKAAANTFTVLIRAEKTTWVSIVADGKPFAQETLIAPANTSVRATREVIVKTGNAAGVSFLLNGKEIPADGSEGEVRTYVFDAHTVRVVPQTQAPAQIPQE
jgi:hypothetical protein